MTPYRVVFAPEALAQLQSLFSYIAAMASPDVVRRYTNEIVTYCEGLHVFPLRGNRRDDIRPGLRITNYKTMYEMQTMGHTVSRCGCMGHRRTGRTGDSVMAVVDRGDIVLLSLEPVVGREMQGERRRLRR